MPPAKIKQKFRAANVSEKVINQKFKGCFDLCLHLFEKSVLVNQ